VNATDLLNPKVVQNLIGQDITVTLGDGRVLNGRFSDFDRDLNAVTLSLENHGVLTTHRFPVSMIRNVQTR
jgi:hypothetical protein